MSYSVIIDREQTGFKMECVYVVKTGGDPELDRVATIDCPDGRDEQIATAHLFASSPKLRDCLSELWEYAQNLEKIIRDGIYRSEELNDPAAWLDADKFAYNGDGASMRDMVADALTSSKGGVA